MHLVKVRLKSDGTEREPLDAAIVTDLIWAHSLTRHGVEHVWVATRLHVTTLVLFIRAVTEVEARVNAAEVAELARGAPALRGWRVE